ncbi:MAG TPA: hypothetical protein VHF92_08105 [Geodermatophilus sp.]|nr:hypothetical protein [Geodermatophilus sp.]
MTDPYGWEYVVSYPPAPAPPPMPPQPPRRPGVATAAAVLALVEAGLTFFVVVVGLAVVGAGSGVGDVGVAAGVALLAIGYGAMLLLGGVFLLRGTGRVLLLVFGWVSAGLTVGLIVIGLVDSAASGLDPDDVLALLFVTACLALPIVRLCLAYRPAVAAWVAASRQHRALPPMPVWAPQLGQWVAGRPASNSTGAVVAVLASAAALALVATVVIAQAGSSELTYADPPGAVEDFGSGASGEEVSPPQPGDSHYDARYDASAVDCYGGFIAACDDLYWETPVGSYYEWYGSTCGGRLDYEALGECVAILGPTD